jgi:hypothetical protein
MIRLVNVHRQSTLMKFILKMVFFLIPLTIVTILSAVVLTVYMVINASKLEKSIVYDNQEFLEG